MYPRGSEIIDFVEAVYDLDASDADWLPGLIDAGSPVLDRGLGVFALTGVRPIEAGPVSIERVYIASGPSDLAGRMARAQSELDMAVFWPLSEPGVLQTLSEMTWERDPAVFQRVMQYFDFAKDALGISAREPNGHALYIIIPLPSMISLSPRARERWQMLTSHFEAGYRLRRVLHSAQASSAAGLPNGAEALIEPTRFRVTEAQGAATSRGALDALRQAAIQVDRARGKMRESEPEKALEMWRGLVRGRWSTVDWFDSDGRRFVLGVPNELHVADPRGLSEREYQVVAYAAAGQTNKMIGYNLGLSKGRVSTLLSSATRKLGAQNRAQLIKMFRGFNRALNPEGPAPWPTDGSPEP